MGIKTSTQSLSIEALESDLLYARAEREKATNSRLEAQEIEDQWITEEKSLTNLIEVRRKRIHGTNGTPPRAETLTVSDMEAMDDIPAKVSEEAISHVDWIYNFVVARGSAGVSPPEVLVASAIHGKKMHKNYPYVVLGGLVEKGKIVKKNGRYFKA